jgi:sorting and assembly machinery component 37
MPIPQRYYVPNRIRELYKPRLEAVGLWPTETETLSGRSKFGASLLGKPPPKKDPKEIARNVFALEQVRFLPFSNILCLELPQTLEKARACLDTYTKLLNGRMFFYHEKCASLFLSFFPSRNLFRTGHRR